MYRFIDGEDRRQQALLPHSLEDYVGEENPVRVVEVFINELDLAALGFSGMTPAATGRPAYHPSTMLKIYLYGYLNRVQSSRRLEREAQRNTELMWLTGRLAPDFKTIADCRKDNGAAIRAVCARFVVLCRQLGLFTRAVVAIDGSKFKAVNNRDKNYTVAKVTGDQNLIASLKPHASVNLPDLNWHAGKCTASHTSLRRFSTASGNCCRFAVGGAQAAVRRLRSFARRRPAVSSRPKAEVPGVLAKAGLALGAVLRRWPWDGRHHRILSSSTPPGAPLDRSALLSGYPANPCGGRPWTLGGFAVSASANTIVDAAREAWQKLIAMPESMTSIGMREWAPVGQSV